MEFNVRFFSMELLKVHNFFVKVNKIVIILIESDIIKLIN